MSVSASPFIDGQGHTVKSIWTAYNTILKHRCSRETQLPIGSTSGLEQVAYMASRPVSERPASERPSAPEKADESEWEVDVRELAKQLKDWLRDAKEGELPPHLRRKIYRAKQIIAKARDARRKQL